MSFKLGKKCVVLITEENLNDFKADSNGLWHCKYFIPSFKLTSIVYFSDQAIKYNDFFWDELEMLYCFVL